MDRSNTGSGQHIRAVVARPTLGRTDLYGSVAPTCTAGSHRPARRGRTDLSGGVAPTCPAGSHRPVHRWGGAPARECRCGDL